MALRIVHLKHDLKMKLSTAQAWGPSQNGEASRKPHLPYVTYELVRARTKLRTPTPTPAAEGVSTEADPA